jgi:hypothetical protein
VEFAGAESLAAPVRSERVAQSICSQTVRQRHQVSLLISDVVNPSDAREASERVEAEIGEDLQPVHPHQRHAGGWHGRLAALRCRAGRGVVAASSIRLEFLTKDSHAYKPRDRRRPLLRDRGQHAAVDAVFSHRDLPDRPAQDDGRGRRQREVRHRARTAASATLSARDELHLLTRDDGARSRIAVLRPGWCLPLTPQWLVGELLTRDSAPDDPDTVI